MANPLDILQGKMPTAWRSYATGASFNTSDGILTIGMSATQDVTVDLDGRYGVGGGVGSGNQYAVGYYATAGTTVAGQTVLYVSGTRVGIRTDDPDEALHINDNDAAIVLTYYTDQSKKSTIANTTAGKLDISTTANEVNMDGFNVASTLSSAITSIQDSGDTQGSSDTALVTEGWINANITEGTGSVGSDTQYQIPFYANATAPTNHLTGTAHLTTDGSNNIILSGTSNTFIGGLAGTSMVSGSSNVAVGVNAIATDDLGSKCVAVGQGALYSQNYDTATDGYNVAVGHEALVTLSTATSNTALGGLALYSLQSGHNNVALGRSAMYILLI